MSDKKQRVPARASPAPVKPQSNAGEIDAFIRQARTLVASATGTGRLILALDATMSRQPTWDLATKLQGEMFDAVGKAGTLSVQLAYFRGLGECRSSAFVADTNALKQLMTRIDCRAGHTQIGKVLAHALKETAAAKVNALVYIGDAMEEDIDDLAQKAGGLGLHGVPVFVFQQGHDPGAEKAFKEIARLSKGAWFRFDRRAAATLAGLLSAVAVYATGGLKALEARDRPGDRLLIEHLRGGGN
ncbi:VWA domain-containing protein [Mesorhizobium sp. M0187]|uniref:VWA domain-containing protein n=1 Tax=Mesorhizobium sp. M0187 TaxID=2956908 RepID=UPI00333D4E3C